MKKKFNRWEIREDCTWAFLVYKKHNSELSAMLISQLASSKFTYTTLGKNCNAKFEDKYEDWLPEINEVTYNGFKDIKSWSDSFNKFNNWVNLNCIMAMSANLETYMSTVINLALESDAGVLYGASKKIDGMLLEKHGKPQPFDYSNHVMNCTKGDWNSRVFNFEKIFGKAPSFLKDKIGELEKIRKLRNNVGHAFGRDISNSRKHGEIQIEKMDSLNTKTTIKHLKLIYKIAMEIDKQLFINNIGAYQDLHFYHILRSSLNFNNTINHSDRKKTANILKEKLSRHAAKTVGKEYCKELIDYYESI